MRAWNSRIFHRGRADSGFSIIELMVALLIASAIVLSIASFFRKSSKEFRESELLSDLSQGDILATRTLSDDFVQAVSMRSSCQPNHTGSSVPCSSVSIRGAVTPLPGMGVSDVEALSDFGPVPAMTAAPSSLSFHSDALRLLVYDDFSPCRLNTSRSNNPESGTRMIYVDSSCTSIELGQIYVLMEVIGDTQYADIFQVAALNTVSGIEHQVDAGVGGLFSHGASYGDMGYSNNALIYRVKFVEYAIHESEGGLFRREIVPSASDLSGFRDWFVVSPQAESIQHTYFFANSGGTSFENRVLPSGSDYSLIAGIQPQLITKSSVESDRTTVYNNPHTSVTENDHFPRKESVFFVEMMNRRN